MIEEEEAQSGDDQQEEYEMFYVRSGQSKPSRPMVTPYPWRLTLGPQSQWWERTLSRRFGRESGGRNPVYQLNTMARY